MFPLMAKTGATEFRASITSCLPTSPAWIMRLTLVRPFSAAGRISPCVSEMIPMVVATPLLLQARADFFERALRCAVHGGRLIFASSSPYADSRVEAPAGYPLPTAPM
jgi:hypothetical protein